MPATKARSTNMIRRQSFTGKTLTFIEVIFDQSFTASATTPESDGSTFQTVTNVINSAAGNSIDVYQYIVEGGPETFDAPASAGAATGADSTVKTGAEADIETAILAVLSDDSAGSVGVKVSKLSADGHDTLAGGNPEVIGMFDGRGEA